MSNMFNVYRKEINWGGRPLVIETGKIARQADASTVVTYGDTVVMCNVTAKKTSDPSLDFFPLTVHYQERKYAAGKIPGGFFKREAKPTEKETLVSRLIDRPIRPLFAGGFKNETNVICTVLSHDMENDPDIVAMIAASSALTISGLPFMGPIGASRVAQVNGEYILNPLPAQLEESNMDLVMAGTQEGVLMVESEIKELPEDVVLGALKFGHDQMQPVIDAIIELAEACAKDPVDVPEASDRQKEAYEKLKELATTSLTEAYKETAKQERVSKLDAARTQASEKMIELGFEKDEFASGFKKIECDIVRTSILETSSRIDGRGLKDVRQIVAEVGLLPRAHGCALFTRGETQALAVATLGTGQDSQIMDMLEGESRQHFMLHYNFPPYSVGEVGRYMGPGRRELGHGKLAWRAIHPVLPSKEDFPYTMRVVSEITESNGSSSMATVCGTSLALMDAGVPIKSPVAGIAMGLIKEGEKYAVLSDILGDEDHLGDMDFKVAGTSAGITSLQMDLKITSINHAIMGEALEQAREGRLHILDRMAEALTESRDEMNEFAPKIQAFHVPKDKIRDIIGPGGKMIREIVEVTGAKVDIDDDGLVHVASVGQEAGKKAYEWIQGLVAEPEIGVEYDGLVAKVVDFGAFVDFLQGKSGLVHISEMADQRVEKVTDIVNEGDKILVKVIGVDHRGKVKLSMKAVGK